MRCKLCQLNVADKKGSHMVPHFLLKRIDNQEGTTGRDKELGFVLSERNPSSYFGRATSPKKIEELHGEITYELIDKNEIPLIEDHVFCTSCEKRLAVIESEYASTLKKSAKEDSNYDSGVNPMIGLLFWSSIVWRLSIAAKSGFRLRSGDEKRLRRILNRYLSLELKDIVPKKNDPDLPDTGYRILRVPDYSLANSTVLFCHPNFQKPYYFIIDEFVLAFYFSREYLKESSQQLADIGVQLKKADFNTAFKGELVHSMPQKIIEGAKAYFYDELSRRYLNSFSRDLDQLHRWLGGMGLLPMAIKQEIFKKMAHDENVAMGQKYTLKHKAKVVYEVLSRFINK